MAVFALNDYGQVGVFYKGVNPPASGDLIWHQVDAQGNHIAWKEKVNGVWKKINDTVILDVLNSFDANAALSANQGRILRALITVNENAILALNQGLADYVHQNQRNIPGGFAGLGPNGKIDPALLDLDGLVPVDVWNASAGYAPDANPQEKEYWIVNVAGNYNLGGINTWQIGDRALFLRGAWNRIPASPTNNYNALDQVNAGFTLDARQGKVLRDLITALEVDVNDNASAINSLVNLVSNLQAANTVLTNALATKQGLIKRLPPGTIQNEKFIHADLAGVQYGQLEVVVGGMMLIEAGDFTKTPADNFIAIPGALDGTTIQVKIYPL